MSKPFVRAALRLARWRAHHEASRRDRHHFGTLVAIAKGRGRLRWPGLRGRGGRGLLAAAVNEKERQRRDDF